MFSKIDLVPAYHQITVFTEDVEKATVTITLGLFEFLRMSSGDRSAAHNFQFYR